MTLPLSRRRVIASTSGAALIPVLSSCGLDEGLEEEELEPPATGISLMGITDVPVGGCAVNADLKIVVSQPVEGDFKAFSAVCTHQGCLVDSSADGEIPCKCHGSRFSLTDGSVLTGPATEALAQVGISVVDGVVTAG